MPGEPLLVGVDLGTTSIKALVFTRTRSWLNAADYIAYRLCGVPATDHSLASRTLAHIDAREAVKNCLLRFVGYIAENPTRAGLRDHEYWLYKGGASLSSVCIAAEGQCEGQTGMSAPPSHLLPQRLDKPLCEGGVD